MNLRDLRYLVALAEHKHFGRAAAASFVSQPTLSTQIRKLEDELGVSLVERTPRKVLLTEVGREIAQRARDVLLPDEVGEPLGAILPGEHEIRHRRTQSTSRRAVWGFTKGLLVGSGVVLTTTSR